MKIEDIQTKNVVFVADMHELVEPNAEARRIWANIQNRSPTDKEFTDLYNNSIDPLVDVINGSLYPKDVLDYGSRRYFLSLGDMIANRINFGEGTERSVVGKMGKEAREKNIPQHEYIAENYTKKLGEIEDWAYRNSFWTKMRFEKVEETKCFDEVPRMIMGHLNGNADTISSFITRELLNADFPSPNEIYEKYISEGHFYKDKPCAIKFFNPTNEKDYYLTLVVPYTLKWDEQLKELGKMKDTLKDKNPSSSALLIHESPLPEMFGKKENVEGMQAYKKALEIMPEDAIIIHAHTHKRELVEYDFNGYKTFQVPPNEGLSYRYIKSQG